jgi:hypothetical protein
LGLANVLHYFFAQNIGIAFTAFGKRNELRGDRLFDVVVAAALRLNKSIAFGRV